MLIEIVAIKVKELKLDPWMTVKNNPQKRLPYCNDPASDLKLNQRGGMVQYQLAS